MELSDSAPVAGIKQSAATLRKSKEWRSQSMGVEIGTLLDRRFNRPWPNSSPPIQGLEVIGGELWEKNAGMHKGKIQGRK